ncbi:hypothetical protein KY363_03130 [Candidatus Woesearchaeota archaeon]|nr:hypothetical protein [Candidatus Woesearchaeota archaeon]
MGLFSKKEDTRYVKEFDVALLEINALAKQFRDIHFESLEMFDRNFKKEKTPQELEKERMIFERHLEVLQKLRFQADILFDEAFRLVRNETALTEKDRQELHRLMEPREKTSIKVPGRGK